MNINRFGEEGCQIQTSNYFVTEIMAALRGLGCKNPSLTEGKIYSMIYIDQSADAINLAIAAWIIGRRRSSVELLKTLSEAVKVPGQNNLANAETYPTLERGLASQSSVQVIYDLCFAYAKNLVVNEFAAMHDRIVDALESVNVQKDTDDYKKNLVIAHAHPRNRSVWENIGRKMAGLEKTANSVFSKYQTLVEVHGTSANDIGGDVEAFGVEIQLGKLDIFVLCDQATRLEGALNSLGQDVYHLLANYKSSLHNLYRASLSLGSENPVYFSPFAVSNIWPKLE